MLSFRFRKHKMRRYLQFVLLFCLFGFMLSMSIPEDKFSIFVEVDKRPLKRIRRKTGQFPNRDGGPAGKFKDIDQYMKYEI